MGSNLSPSNIAVSLTLCDMQIVRRVQRSGGVLLFACAMAACALVMPSTASAASWGPVGSHHLLHSPDFRFQSPSLGTITSSCPNLSFTFRVLSASDAQISTAFSNVCTADGTNIGACTVTWTATNLPWTATAVTTSNIQIHGIDMDFTYEQTPLGLCQTIAGLRIKITGTLTGGIWNASQHEITYTNADGLTSHSALGNGVPITVSATFRDTQQTLTVS
jgi:hypothetical protein